MKKSFILFAALAALFSCTKETPVSPETPSQETYSVTLTAVAPTAGDDTKTTLVEGGKFVHWSKGDAIKVMFFVDPPQTSVKFDNPGQILTSYFTDDTSAEANFRIDSWPMGTHNIDNRSDWFKKKGLAVYPASATAYSNKVTTDMYAWDAVESKVAFTLPEVQTAVEGNIESGLNFSYAEVDFDGFRKTLNQGSETKLQFKNACAMIKLTMPQSFGGKIVKSIMVTSADQKALAGYASLKLENTSNISTQNVICEPFTMLVSGDVGVTLTSETGFEPGKSYYAVVWPGEHSALKFTFIAEDESTAEITTKSAVSLQASHVKPYSFSSTLQFEESESYVYYAPGEGVGKYYYSNGTVGDNPEPKDRVILGVVFSNENPRNNDGALPEHCVHGLAIRVKNKAGVQWYSGSQMPTADFMNHSKLCNVGEDWGYNVKVEWENTYPGVNINLYTADYSIDSYDLPVGETSGWYHATGREWEIIKNNKDAINENLELCHGDATYVNNVKVWYPVMYNRSDKWQAYCFYNSNWGMAEEKQNINNMRINARPIFAF